MARRAADLGVLACPVDVANPKVRQDRPWRQPKPAPDHPWRGAGEPVAPTLEPVFGPPSEIGQKKTE